MDAADAKELLALLSDADAWHLAPDEWLPLLPLVGGQYEPPASPRLALDSCPTSVTNRALLAPADASTSSAAGESAGVMHTTTHTAVPTTTEAKPVDPRRKRLTPKQELARLRVQVERLGLELNSLKAAVGIDLATPVARYKPHPSEISADTNAEHIRLWEKLARHQLERRRASETENRALRDGVITQIRLVTRLQEIVRKRALDQTRGVSRVLRGQQRPTPVLLSADSDAFCGLVSGLEELYTEIDATFARVRMHEVPRPGRSSRSRLLPSSRWVVEIRDVHVLPFAFREAERAVWAFHAGKNAEQIDQEARHTVEFTYAHPARSNINMQMRSVMRRYREEKRTVLVGRARISPGPGISVEQVTQVVVKAGPRSFSGPTSAIETYITGSGSVSDVAKSTPAQSRQPSDRAPWDGDFGVALWEMALSRSQETIEDLLVAASLVSRA